MASLGGIPEWALEARSHWRHTGQDRPAFAALPQDGQESVWDYPRPPRFEVDERELVVRFGATVIARSRRALRVLETASPPTFYLPREDVEMAFLEAGSGASMCEWKGRASYWNVIVDGERIERAAWSYAEPLPGFEALKDWLAFYPEPLVCSIGGVVATRQPGRFYAGWVTPEIVGPFKGEPGSDGW